MSDQTAGADHLSPGLRLLRRALPLAMVYILLAGISGGVFLAQSVGKPFAGVVLSWRKDYMVLAVGYHAPFSWPGLGAGLELNDRVLCIDGYRPSSGSQVYGLDPLDVSVRCPKGNMPYGEIYRQGYTGGATAVEFLVDRRGTLVTVPNVPLVRFSLANLAEIYLPWFLACLGFLALALVAYRAGSTTEMNLLFAWFCLIFAALMVHLHFQARITASPPWYSFVGMPFWAFSTTWLGPVFFHLVGKLTGDWPRPSLVVRLRRPFYAVSCVLSLLMIAKHAGGQSSLGIRLTRPVDVSVAAVCLLFTIWGLVALGWSWRRAPLKRVRRQAGFIWLGILATLVSALPYIAWYYTDVPVLRRIESVPYLGLVVVAIFAYAILRYQIFASKSTVLSTLLVATLAILAANVVYLVLGRVTGFLPILAAALVTTWALEMRRGPTSFFTQMLRREVLDYNTVVQFTQDVGALQQVEPLLESARGLLREALSVEALHVWLLEPESRALLPVGEDGATPSGQAALDLALSLADHPGPVRAGSLEAACYAPIDMGDVAVWAPLADRGHAVGLVGLGTRWTGEVFDDQDLQLVAVLARQLALSILNTRQLERLQATSRLVLQAGDHERSKIAEELHGTILQFLHRLTFGIEAMAQDAPAIAGEAKRWQYRIRDEAQRLRSMMSILRAPARMVEQGLIVSVGALVEQARSDSEFDIQADLDPEAEAILPLDAQIAIFRVFREAIQNAMRHSHGTRIAVGLTKQGGTVHFAVQDDGRGFDVAQGLRTEEKGYSSLEDMRIWAQSVGGIIDVRSLPGAGTTVAGHVPATRVA